MTYRQVTREQLEEYIKNNPGATYRVNGQEAQAPYQDEDKGFLMNLLTTLSKPIRTVGGSAYSAITGKEKDNPFFTQREEAEYAKDPTIFGAKQAIGLGSFLLPAGAAKGVTGMKAVGQAAGRGVLPGAMGGVAFSEEGKELGGALTGGLTGGLFAGALQGIGEVARGIKSAKIDKSGMSTYLDDIDDVTKVAKLPKKAKSALKSLSESAGFNDPSLSESKNILNYIKNRQLAGKTPGQTLENMTQEFARASQLKQEGLEEIGGLSRSYLEQAQNNFDDAIRYKGLSLDKEGTGVYNDIRKTFLTGPQDAKSLDDILMKWNEAGRNAKGAQKMGLTGLYADASKSLRDVLRTTNPGGKYDIALKQLSQILGLDDEGVVAAASSAAEKAGINLPMFQNAGVYGTDIKTPFISNTISKARAGLAEGQLQRALGTQATQGTQAMPQLLQNIISGGQRLAPAISGLIGGQTSQPAQTSQPIQPSQYQAPQQQGVNALNIMLAQEVLNGNISATEANAVLSLLGMGSGGELSSNQSKAQALQGSLDSLRSVWEGSGAGARTMETLGLNIGTGARSLDQAKAVVAENLGRLQSQGAINEQERVAFLQMLPNVWDSPEVVQQKFDSIQNIINSY